MGVAGLDVVAEVGGIAAPIPVEESLVVDEVLAVELAANVDVVVVTELEFELEVVSSM